MKKLLYITGAVPGKRGGGGEAYSYALIRELSKGVCIDVFYFHYADDAPMDVPNENIRIVGSQKINAFYKLWGVSLKPCVFPLFASRYSLAAERTIQELERKNHYDVLYFDFSQTFIFAERIAHPNKVLMAHDIIAQKYMRKQRLLLRWVINTERRLLKNGTKIFTFSQKDCDIVKRIYQLDSEFTTFFLDEKILAARPVKLEDYFVFFGAWGREENYNSLLWFIEEVLPLVDVSVRIKIVGGGQMPRKVMKILALIPQLEYIGFAEDPYPIIAKARAEIVPLKHGAGVKVKCVEALACGTPVIGTDVAFEGIPVHASYEKNMILANSAEEFAAAMKRKTDSAAERIERKRAFCSLYDGHKKIMQYLLEP